MLDTIQTFIEEINKTNSRLDKEKVLANYKDNSIIMKLLNYTFSYDIQYYVTSSNVIKLKDTIGIDNSYNPDLFNMLDLLRTRAVTGNRALRLVNTYISFNKQHESLIYKIIDKDLGIGVATKTINDICPGTIKIFNVALAQDLRKKPKIKLDNNWVIERKLDGCRCCCIIDSNGNPKFYSRTGLEYTTLNNLIPDIKALGLEPNTVIDGEICIIDKEGKEDFQGIMKVIKRKDYTIANPYYIMFDLIPLDVFEGKVQGPGYKERINKLEDIYNNADIKHDLQHVEALFYMEYNEDNLEKMKRLVNECKWEGLMFRKDVPFEAKRTDNLLKLKSFFDDEYKVLATESGEITEVIDGKAQKIVATGSLLIDHKGYMVKVGSGLTLEQRKAWYADPTLIIGKTITVSYFEETQDKHGNYSLRFPTLKVVHGEERNV